MGWSCQGYLACSHEDGHWVEVWQERGRKGERHTRWFHSGEPVPTTCVKKRKRRKKKTGLWKTRGKTGGELYLPLNEPHSFLSSSDDFSLSFLPMSVSPLSHSCEFIFLLLCLIILSSSVSLRHVFQSLPSIDTVSTNSSPPVPRGEPLGKAKSWGKACWVRGDMADKRERYRALPQDNHCSSI